MGLSARSSRLSHSSGQCWACQKPGTEDAGDAIPSVAQGEGMRAKWRRQVDRVTGGKIGGNPTEKLRNCSMPRQDQGLPWNYL